MPSEHRGSMAHPRVLQLGNLLQPCIKRKALFSGKSIHAQILGSGFSLDTFLSNRLVELYTQCGQFDFALSSFCATPNPNLFSWNAVLSSASKSGNIELALQLFDQMPEKNVVSWNTIISAQARRGKEEAALNLYRQLIQQGLMPTHFTFASVLSACASLASLIDGQKCHGFVLKIGLDSNLFAENALLVLYAKCGVLHDALRMFDEMTHPNEVSFTTIIGGLVQSGCPEEALRLFERMHRSGVFIDQVAVSSALGACARIASIRSGHMVGQSIHAFIFKHGFESETHVGNSLIDMYAKHGSMESAELIFNSLPTINGVSWNVMIAGHGLNGDAGKAMDMWKMMQESQFEPDDVTYISMLTCCVKYGDIETARQMLDKMNFPSVASYNAMLSGYCQNGDHQEAIELFREMQFSNLEPDRTTLAVILSSCSGIGILALGKQVHGSALRASLHEDTFVSSGLVDMYSKCGRIEAASQVFHSTMNRDIVSWNSMITGFAHHSLNREALSLFKTMRREGLSPTESSYASAINSCAGLSSLPQGRQAHAQVLKHGYAGGIFVGSSLIDMYAKCGAVDEARRFFDAMPTKNIVSWNEMIHGYAQNGRGEEAVRLFESMIGAEERLDSVTFIAVLTACSHAGLVEEGMKFFRSMRREHGVEPLADHYACILDALGRAGRLRDAEAVLDEMPYRDDPIVWEVVLSACALHGDAGLGRRAAEQLFRIDPNNSAPYVLLANVYASAGRWEDATAVRRLMSARGVVKDRGYSWISGKSGAVRAFMVDDCLRLQDADRGNSFGDRTCAAS